MSEWGPWIEHDGSGCHCLGKYVMAEHDEIDRPGVVIYRYEGIAGSEGGFSWDWSNSQICTRIIRYRMRRPKGLTILTDILREVENTKQPEYTN